MLILSITSRKKRGFNSERELVERFREMGLWGIRIPASGVGTPIPDVLIFHNGVIYGFEVKSTNKSNVTYYLKDFDNLVDWFKHMREENFNASAWLAVRFRGGTWRFYNVDLETAKVECNPNTGLALVDLSREIREKGRKLFT